MLDTRSLFGGLKLLDTLFYVSEIVLKLFYGGSEIVKTLFWRGLKLLLANNFSPLEKSVYLSTKVSTISLTRKHMSAPKVQKICTIHSC